jgi:hypothetical protein
VRVVNAWSFFVRSASVAILIAALPGRASAELGGALATVDSDRVKMQGALLRITQTRSYALHEVRTAAGTNVRQFVSPSGTVFGVAWDGPWQPDLHQILGAYFDRFTQAVQAVRRVRRGRGPLAIRDGDLVVEVGGHARAFVGHAFLAPLIPQGVDPSSIQ